MLKESGLSKGRLAQKMRISRVRLTQMLNLLKLPQERQDYVLKHGRDELITERMLRKAVSG